MVFLRATDGSNTKIFAIDIDAAAAPGDGTQKNPLLSTPVDLINLAADVNNGNDYAGEFLP
jgi:hypothetical protein